MLDLGGLLLREESERVEMGTKKKKGDEDRKRKSWVWDGVGKGEEKKKEMEGQGGDTLLFLPILP